MKTDVKNAGFLNTVRKFHEEEDGMEAIQVVMIIAIAAIALAIIQAVFPDIRRFFKDAMDKILKGGWGS